MIMAATAMILVFMVVFSEVYQDNIRDKKQILAQDFGYSVQNEFIIAVEAKPGYKRMFQIPSTLEGFPFEISNTETTLIINYTDNTLMLPIPEVKGNIRKGPNIMTYDNNTICLNC
jgi:hypothetical protein